MDISEEIARPLSGKEVMKIVNNKANVMNYRELQEYDSLKGALGKYKALILLYESEKNFGHWTLIFRSRDGIIEHFDSYGYKPDDELIGIPENFKKKNYNSIPHLTYLLYMNNEPVRFSQYKLQKHGAHINTCGRWVAMRLLLRDITEDEFHKLMTKPKRINSDDLVTRTTEIILNR